MPQNAFDTNLFLIALSPKSLRNDLSILSTFNDTLFSLTHGVTDSASYHLKLQWWLYALNDIARSQKTRTPIADSLGIIIKKYSLPLPRLEQMITARWNNLNHRPFESFDSLHNYAQQTGGSLFSLWSCILFADSSDSSVVPNALGTAWAMMGLWRNILLEQSLNRSPIPMNASCPDPFAFGTTPVRQAIAHGVAMAVDMLPSHAQSHRFYPLSLLSALILDYAHSFHKAGYDPRYVDLFDPSRLMRFKLLWLVLSSSVRRKLAR